MRKITPPKNSGYASGLLGLISWGLDKSVPDLDPLVPLAVLVVGILLFVWWAADLLHDKLSERVGGCISATIVIGLSLAALSGVGAFLYQQQNYRLKYQMCFGHIPQDTPAGVKIMAVKVFPRLVPDRDMYVQVVDPSLQIETSASTVPPDSKPRFVKRGAIAAFTDFVAFNPKPDPHPMNGTASYEVRYGTDKEHLKEMTIKGAIYYYIGENTGHLGGYGTFTPDDDPDNAYMYGRCSIKDNNEVVYSEDQRAL